MVQENHPTTEEIIKYIEIIEEKKIDEIDFFERIDEHILKCKKCYEYSTQMRAKARLFDKFIDKPKLVMRTWERWTKEKRQKYQERAVKLLLNRIEHDDEFYDLMENDGFLKERLKAWVNSRKERVVDEVYFISIFPDLSWRYEYDNQLKKGKLGESSATKSPPDIKETDSLKSCNIALKFANFYGFGNIGPEYVFTPPITFIVPKNENNDTAISVPERTKRNVWQANFFNVLPGVYALVTELEADQLSFLKKSITVK